MDSQFDKAPIKTHGAENAALPKVEMRAPSYTTFEWAEAFAQSAARNEFNLPNAQVSAMRVGAGFVPQIWVERALLGSKLSPVVATILVGSDGKAAGLRFCAYTDECDSGHECHWCEDLTGRVFDRSILPR